MVLAERRKDGVAFAVEEIIHAVEHAGEAGRHHARDIRAADHDQRIGQRHAHAPRDREGAHVLLEGAGERDDAGAVRRDGGHDLVQMRGDRRFHSGNELARARRQVAVRNRREDLGRVGEGLEDVFAGLLRRQDGADFLIEVVTDARRQEEIGVDRATVSPWARQAAVSTDAPIGVCCTEEKSGTTKQTSVWGGDHAISSATTIACIASCGASFCQQATGAGLQRRPWPLILAAWRTTTAWFPAARDALRKA